MNVITKILTRPEHSLTFRGEGFEDPTRYVMPPAEWLELQRPERIVVQVSLPGPPPKDPA